MVIAPHHFNIINININILIHSRNITRKLRPNRNMFDISRIVIVRRRFLVARQGVTRRKMNDNNEEFARNRISSTEYAKRISRKRPRRRICISATVYVARSRGRRGFRLAFPSHRLILPATGAATKEFLKGTTRSPRCRNFSRRSIEKNHIPFPVRISLPYVK